MSAPAKPEAAPPAATPEKSGGSMMPVILVVVLVPALCYGATNYLLLPKLKASLISELAVADGAGEKKPGSSSAEAKASEHGKPAAHGKKETSHGKKEGAAEGTFEFGTTVVNLSGAMGQRFLRANFVLAGGDAKLEEILKENQSALRDVAINVLSSQSLASLESPGAKNIVRNELITQFNRTLGAEVVEQLYFSEFVIQ